ncbi:MAG: DUF58 domain-containing protein [Candidatus Woesearchaeota archaeon]
MAIDLSFLHKLDRMSLIINKRLTSNYVGERRSIATGRGLIFKDHAIYAPGDDFRAIDWKVLARLDKLFIKRYEEERNLTVHVIVDYSGSMAFGGRTKKYEYADMLGLGFCYMAMKHNEKFVVSTFADRLEVFKPKRGRSNLMRVLDYLNAKKPKGLSKFESSLAAYKKRINTRSYVVILSDFLYDTEEIKNAIKRYKDHHVVLIQVLDKTETDLDIEGDFKLVDAETEDTLRTFISPYARKNYLEQLADHQAKIKKACDEIGAKFFVFSTEYPIFDAFYEVLNA